MIKERTTREARYVKTLFLHLPGLLTFMPVAACKVLRRK